MKAFIICSNPLLNIKRPLIQLVTRYFYLCCNTLCPLIICCTWKYVSGFVFKGKCTHFTYFFLCSFVRKFLSTWLHGVTQYYVIVRTFAFCPQNTHHKCFVRYAQRRIRFW